MLYGSETWPLKEDDLKRLERNDNRMTRWMCGVTLQQKISSSEIRNRLQLCSIRECVKRRRLEWFGHLERMEIGTWASRCRNIEIEGSVPKGRTKLTWNELIKKDLKDKNLTKEQAQDRVSWKSCIKKNV